VSDGINGGATSLASRERGAPELHDAWAPTVEWSLAPVSESSRLRRQHDTEGLIVVTGVGWPGKLSASLAKGLGWPGRRDDAEAENQPLPDPLAFIDVSRETARLDTDQGTSGEDEFPGWSISDQELAAPSDVDGNPTMVQTLDPTPTPPQVIAPMESSLDPVIAEPTAQEPLDREVPAPAPAEVASQLPAPVAPAELPPVRSAQVVYGSPQGVPAGSQTISPEWTPPARPTDERQPVWQPVAAAPLGQPLSEVTSNGLPEPISEPAAEPISEPVAQPVSEPVQATEPSVHPAYPPPVQHDIQPDVPAWTPPVAQVEPEASISTSPDIHAEPQVRVEQDQDPWTSPPDLPEVVEHPALADLPAADSPDLPVMNVSPGSLHDFDDSTPLALEVAEDTRRRLALTGRRFPRPSHTRVITVANQKGGVGKTTTTVNMAAALAQSGLRVLVLDIDPQGNASTALGVDHHTEVDSVYDVLVDGTSLAEVIQPCPDIEGLYCAPATIDLAGAEIELVSMVARETRMRRALDAFLEESSKEGPSFDYVLIDCPPSLGLLTVNAFVAAREVLIPIQCEYYALEGLSQLLRNVELIKGHLNPELKVSTILLTMYDGRTRLSAQVADEVRAHFPDEVLKTTVPRSVRISEAPSHGQTVMTYDAVSSGALSYLEAARELAEQVLAADDVSGVPGAAR
jgi:chromosome partitioning protein